MAPPSRLLETRRRAVVSDMINELAEDLGPRPATSTAEAEAAARVAALLRRVGMEVGMLSFTTSRGPTLGLLALTALGLVALASGFWLPLPAALLALWVTLLSWRELRGHRLLGGLLQRGTSQNVLASRAATERPRWRVVLLCQLDAPRALGPQAALLLRLGLLSIPLGLLALTGLLAGSIWVPLLSYAALVPGAGLAVALVLLLWRELRARWSTGTTSAAAAGVAAAAGAAQRDLQYVELWVIALGASCAGGAGLREVLQFYPFPAEETVVISLPSLGSGDLTLVGVSPRETRLPGDLTLIELLEQAARDTGQRLPVRPWAGERLASTQALARGYHAVTLAGLSEAGLLADYRTARLAPADLDAEQIESALALVLRAVALLEQRSLGRMLA